MGNAFHQTAVTKEHPGMVIHNRVPLAIKLGCQSFLRQRHTHRIGQALPQRARGRLNARGISILRGGPAFCYAVAEIA